MANGTNKDSTGRTVAIVGGGALLLWLLLHGKGWGFGGGGGAGKSDQATGATPTDAAIDRQPCLVGIDAAGIEVDGARADLATTTERCRAAGSAEVRATGAAITHVIADVIRALQAAGVQVWASTDAWNALAAVPIRGPA